MLDVATARARILSGIVACGQETVPLGSALGRVLGLDVHARRANPPVSVSAMDGYAARAQDATEAAVLHVVAEAPAGHPTAHIIQPGECVRLFTGSQIPAGADTVIIQENTQREGNRITLTHSSAAGRFIRMLGQDFAQGTCLLQAGTRLGPKEIGLAAAGGHAWLTVTRKPRVSVLSTGDEIALPGDPVCEDGIFNSALFMVTACLQQAGAEVLMLPSARDTTRSLTEAFAQARQSDMLVTIGGASVGAYDLVRQSLTDIGLTLDFWKIAMRPGKPLLSGHIGSTPIIGLPGNPVAALVCSTVFVAPAIQRMMGMAVADTLPTEPAILGVDVGPNDQRQDFLRATLSNAPAPDSLPVVTPFASQDSAQLHILAQSQALIIRAPHAPAAAAGSPCQIVRLS
ncbi:MAG: gephyrin-like molybdotransferase Glp [Acetobacter papayae]|uniref:molybdopterin molybdotransferase MoeA n=1 Tax=Acetobacter papayae TaxID=1076592 RepID=UPI0039ECC288